MTFKEFLSRERVEHKLALNEQHAQNRITGVFYIAICIVITFLMWLITPSSKIDDGVWLWLVPLFVGAIIFCLCMGKSEIDKAERDFWAENTRRAAFFNSHSKIIKDVISIDEKAEEELEPMYQFTYDQDVWGRINKKKNKN